MGMLNKATIFLYLVRALVMLIAIPFHEAAHAWVSYKLGDSTAKDAGRLSLNPMAHFDLLGALCMVFVGVGWAKPVPTNPRHFKNPKFGMALSASAGPIANILLAFVSMVLYKVIYYITPDTAGWGFVLFFLLNMARLNIMLAVFNLLPVPPLDGSRLMTVFLPQRTYFKIMQYEHYIMMGMFLLLIAGVLDTPLAFLNNVLWNFMMWSTSFVDKLFLTAMHSITVLA